MSETGSRLRDRGPGFAPRMLVLVVLLALSACGGRNQVDLNLENRSAEGIFADAEALLASGREERSAQMFAEIERLHPYSEWAKRAMIMSAFAYHEAGEFEQSRSAAQRYLSFYPADEDAAYAQYLIALSYYDQVVDIGRDQGATFQALQELRVVIERYPDSEFARSARLKFDLALDHLAGKEMDIGRYHLKRGHFSPAINRFRVVVEDYETTSHTAEALYRLIEAYLSLGLDAEAQSAGAILGHNFRGSQWYSEAHALLTGRGLEATAQGDGWLARLYRQVIRGEWI